MPPTPRNRKKKRSNASDLTSSSSASSRSSSSTDLASSSSSDLTHKELGERFKDLGRWIASLPAEDDSEPTDLTGQQQKEFDVFKRWLDTPPSKGTFGKTYRALQPRQDEAVSTASVRELINGLSTGLGEQRDDERHDNAIARCLVAVSALRLDTKFTGLALADFVMQHPTKKGTGVFRPQATGRPHYELDLERRGFVEQETRVASEEPDATIESVFREMISAGGGFTVNVMAAPGKAVTVEPYAAGEDTELREQTEKREWFKDLIDEMTKLLGGSIRRRSSQREDAPWKQRRKKSLSPKRGGGSKRDRSRDRRDFSPKPRVKAKPRRRRDWRDPSPEPRLRSDLGVPNTDLQESSHSMMTRARERTAMRGRQKGLEEALDLV